MAIQVICPGCLRRFEVSDRFAGKKGPCPKCGHIIEIPKEKVIVHAPDEIMVEGRKVKNPQFVRPIERDGFAFTRMQMVWNIVGAIVVLVFAYLFHFLGSGPLKWLAGGTGIFVIAYFLARTGYILVRNPDDLEMFLGRELLKKSVLVAIGYVIAWTIFELLLLYLNPGFYFFAYLVPIALLAAFIPLVIFDTDYGDSLMLFIIFVLCVALVRGIMFMPDGWIWKPIPPMARQKIEEHLQIDSVLPDMPSASPEESASPAKTPKLDKKAPNPSEMLKK